MYTCMRKKPRNGQNNDSYMSINAWIAPLYMWITLRNGDENIESVHLLGTLLIARRGLRTRMARTALRYSPWL